VLCTHLCSCQSAHRGRSRASQHSSSEILTAESCLAIHTILAHGLYAFFPPYVCNPCDDDLFHTPFSSSNHLPGSRISRVAWFEFSRFDTYLILGARALGRSSRSAQVHELGSFYPYGMSPPQACLSFPHYRPATLSTQRQITSVNVAQYRTAEDFRWFLFLHLQI
jgi:hypothetical protein